MNRSPRKRLGLSLGSVIALLALVIGGIALPAPTAAQEDPPHPAHVHVGDCSAPGEVVGPLNNLDGSDEEGALDWSQSNVELTIDDMLAEPHSIVVHESEENIGNYVLCGDIGGVVTDGTLTVALNELNGSGMAGLAILRQADAGTDVTAIAIDDASVAGTADDAGADAHPAHVHNGSCEAPADVIFPLEDIAAPDGDVMGADVSGVEQSTTKINVSLGNLLDDDHSIVAHLSADDIATYLVCGDLTGEPVDGTLVIQLNEWDGSGYTGVAILTETDGGTNVQAFLMPGISGGAGGDTATPEMDMEGMDHGDMGDDEADDESASDDSGDAAASGEDVSATIVDFTYEPGTIEISVGTTVTWTNEDSAPHTVTANGGAFQSGRMDQGATFSFTFTEPGTYEYYCEFHPNMVATVIVS